MTPTSQDRTPAFSIVTPMLNAATFLPRVLAGLKASSFQDFEFLLVDDGSTDGSRDLAEAHGVSPLWSGGRKGAGPARNVGVEQARAPILVFLDADVAPHPQALSQIAARFEADPGLAALMGAYDDAPAAPGVVSRFRNLLHTHFHRVASPDASTFWTGLGAVRREAFDRVGGFSQTEILEDVEFGVRLKAVGERILLDPSIQGTHLKDWTVASIVRTDLFRRGIPWIELALRRDMMRDDLNTGMAQRLSVAATGVFLLAVAAALLVDGLAFATPAAGVAAALLLPLIGTADRKGRGAAIWGGVGGLVVGAVLWASGHHSAAGVVAAAGLLTAFSPLLFEPRSSVLEKGVGLVLAAALALSLMAMPLSPLTLIAGGAWAVQIGLNHAALTLMAQRMGPVGLLGSLPLLMLYHACCGVCVIVGTAKHLAGRLRPAAKPAAAEGV